MDYHILAGTRDGNAFRVVHHIPIPAGNNRASISYRTALVNSGLGGTTVLVEGTAAGQITTAEKAQVLSGELFEHVEEVATNPGETAIQLRDRIDLRHTQLRSVVLARMQSALAYFGFTRTVP